MSNCPTVEIIKHHLLCSEKSLIEWLVEKHLRLPGQEAGMVRFFNLKLSQ